MSPLLSIIIPIYNVEKYLPQCIESVLCQIREDIEILLIDDGSLDNCDIICKSYAMKHENVHAFHKSNGGLSDARNFGIEKATGKYLMFLDADDKLVENSLVPLLNKISYPSNYDVIIGRYFFCKEEKPDIVECQYAFLNEEIQRKTREDLINYIFSTADHYDWYAWLNIVKKDFIIDKKLFFQKGVIYEDIYWTPNVLMLADSIGYFNDPFYIYTLGRKGSITKTFSYNNYNAKIEACMYLFNICQKYRFSRETSCLIEGNMNFIFTSLLAEYYFCSKDMRKKVYGKLCSLISILKNSKRDCDKVLYLSIRLTSMKLVAFLLYVRLFFIYAK